MSRTVSDSVTVGTAPFNGAFVYGWAASRFSSRPAEGAAPPSGSPDAGPVVTGPVWGGEGAFDIVLPDVDCYLQVVVGTQVAWGRSPATGGGGITWPLAYSGHEHFQPDGVANAALTLQNGASATGGLTVIGSAGGGISLQPTDVTPGNGVDLNMASDTVTTPYFNVTGAAGAGTGNATLMVGGNIVIQPNDPSMVTGYPHLTFFEGEDPSTWNRTGIGLAQSTGDLILVNFDGGDIEFRPSGMAFPALAVTAHSLPVNGIVIEAMQTGWAPQIQPSGTDSAIGIGIAAQTAPGLQDVWVIGGPGLDQMISGPNGAYLHDNGVGWDFTGTGTQAHTFDGKVSIAGSLGVFGHAAPGAQPATPVTLGDVIALLQSYGLSA